MLRRWLAEWRAFRGGRIAENHPEALDYPTRHAAPETPRMMELPEALDWWSAQNAAHAAAQRPASTMGLTGEALRAAADALAVDLGNPVCDCCGCCSPGSNLCAACIAEETAD